AHALAAEDDDLLDLVVGDAQLPVLVGVVARPGVELRRHRAGARAVHAVAQRARLREERLRGLARRLLRRRPGLLVQVDVLRRRRLLVLAAGGAQGAQDERDPATAHSQALPWEAHGINRVRR